MVRLSLFILLALSVFGCRADEGEACRQNDDCGLGLYCPADREVCTDRGELLRKKAAETYVYPIPLAVPGGKGVKGAKGGGPGKIAPGRAPVPVVAP